MSRPFAVRIKIALKFRLRHYVLGKVGTVDASIAAVSHPFTSRYSAGNQLTAFVTRAPRTTAIPHRLAEDALSATRYIASS